MEVGVARRIPRAEFLVLAVPGRPIATARRVVVAVHVQPEQPRCVARCGTAARAAAVADYLMAETRLQTGRMTITGLADTKPMADNSTAEGRAKNRRIELYLEE